MASSAPCEANGYHLAHALLLRDSLLRLTGVRLLADAASDHIFARDLFHAPFVVVSHGTEADPVFNYANLQAMRLFGMDWQRFTCLPSRCSAEPLHQDERDHLLKQVGTEGFIDNYRGVRIAATGRRFIIEQATVWNLIDAFGACHGQAAMFDRWQDL